MQKSIRLRHRLIDSILVDSSIDSSAAAIWTSGAWALLA